MCTEDAQETIEKILGHVSVSFFPFFLFFQRRTKGLFCALGQFLSFCFTFFCFKKKGEVGIEGDASRAQSLGREAVAVSALRRHTAVWPCATRRSCCSVACGR
nr:hypothetical protein [Pandoravirus aubagnensis]